MKEQNHVDTTITTIEMCAGYGGIGLGIKRVLGERLRTIAYCELEGFAQANLISKMEAGLLDAAPLWSDLKTFPYESFHGLVDILIAGYPCQPFSSAGKRLGAEDPRHLWPHIARAIRVIQPRLCFFENVEGHISLGLSTVISDLEELGYKVSWGIFSASEVGAPHQRKRVFILAHRNESGWQAGWHNAISSQGRQPHELAACGGDQGGAEELACRECTGLERFYNWNASSEPSEYVGADAWASGERDAWPSRPGEQQFAWEPPRVVANSERGGREKPKYQHTDLSPEPSGCGSEAMGNSTQLFSNGGNHYDEISERFEKVSKPRDPSGEGMGNANPRRLASGIDAGSGAEADRGGQGDIEQAESGQIESNVGLHSHGNSNGLGHAELSGLCDSELAEIREWMVKCDNRTDELRLLGNGVVPATAERAFLTLLQEFTK